MTRKAVLKQKFVERRNKAATLFNSIYLGEDTLTGAWRKIAYAAKALIVAGRKFILDDCVTKASSITYTIILSLVPMLAVALSIYSLYYGVGKNKKELFDQILLLLSEYNIKMNIEPIIDTILRLVENAGKIGGISAVVMIFSATAFFRSLEKSLNHIWNAGKGRPFLLKIIYYWAALTLGPIILGAGLYVATQLSTALSSPNYYSSTVSADGRMWITGDRFTLRVADAGKERFNSVDLPGGAISFENQKVFRFNPESKTFSEQDAPIEPRDLKKYRLKGIRFIGDRGWIVGTDGILLTTINGGSRWKIRKYHDFNFNDIYMTDTGRGFIVAEYGRLLSTVDSGSIWDVTEWEGQPNLTSITFKGKTGIITGSRGFILRTGDGGVTWEQQTLQGARRQNRFADINASFMLSKNEIWLTGGDGTILYSEDGGKSWASRTFQDTQYHAVCFINADVGVVAGNGGVLARTADRGKTWELSNLPMRRINSIQFRDERLWAVGDAGMIMASGDRGATWRYVKKGRTFAHTIINFLAPFAIIWLLFLLTYITLPNARVPFRPAALGASFTSAVWVLFILGFIVYVKSFAGSTFLVYGALASIPLFLLMLYASSLIVLFGAEVAFTLTNPESYRSLRRRRGERDGLQVYNGIVLALNIYRKFESGGGPSTIKELRRDAPGGIEEIDRHLELLLEEGLITRSGDTDYMPANSSANVSLNRIIDAIMRASLGMPVAVGKSPLRSFLAKMFEKITASRKKTIGDLTLKDVIDKE